MSSYNIYQTDAFVLAKKDLGEADQVLILFTEKFGKIYALAPGARYLKSKLRYGIQPLSFTRVGLVAGRDFWRLVDIEAPRAPLISLDEANLELFAKFLSLLERMVQGQERDDSLWSTVKSLYRFLNRNPRLSKEKRLDLEVESAVNLLFFLGYLERKKFSSRKEAVRAVNKAIRESML